MSILFVDTETSGFPSPRVLTTIVQFSYVVYDDINQQIISVNDHIISQPKGFNIPEFAVSIHGISNDKCATEGVVLFPVLDRFIEDAILCNIVVGHNIRFDINVIINAFEHLQRRGEELNIEGIVIYCKNQINIVRTIIIPKAKCTMLLGTNLCAIPRVTSKGIGNGYKYPKLSELHQKIFGTVPPNLHNSLEDVYACMACYNHMVTLDIV